MMRSRDTLIAEVLKAMRAAAMRHHDEPSTRKLSPDETIRRRMRRQAEAAVDVILGKDNGNQ